MKKALIGVVLLVAGGGVGAQEESISPTNAAGAWRETSGARVQLVAAPTAGSEAETGAGSAEPAPAAAPPRYLFGERDDYRWQLGVGAEYFRFQSGPLSASMVGLNTTLTYYTNGWFGLEGDVSTAFSPGTVYSGEHVKFFGGTGGFRIGGRRAKWEPWAHGLVGGSHLQPQTAAGGRSALMAQAGIGVDYRIDSRLSLRGAVDWVYTKYFSQSQNNLQAVAGVVFHF
jgi:hypothetical protein